MKNVRVIFAFACIVVLGCTPRIELERAVSIAVLDFTEYQKTGFLITPEEYHGDYESCGFIEITVRPSLKAGREPPGLFSTGFNLVVGPIEIEEAIEQMYEQALNLGADAITRFKATSKEFQVRTYTFEGVRISGFAIKRKGAFR
jgi:hypothetical protein